MHFIRMLSISQVELKGKKSMVYETMSVWWRGEQLSLSSVLVHCREHLILCHIAEPKLP